MSNNPALETWSLTKIINNTAAVDNFSLIVPRGSVTALLGPNGAGKSTLLKLIIGLKRPTAGGGICLGLDILTRSLQIREKVGYLGEEPRLYGYMTVREFLNFNREFYPRWDDRLVKHYLEVFELPADKKIHQLSQGMKNQLALVATLAHRPEMLLLDEPTAGFDPIKRRLFFNAILKEITAEGGTVLLASHQLHAVERVADRVILMHRGKMVHTCSLDELKAAVKEIRVVFQKDPPEDLFRYPGVEEVIREGRAYRIRVSANLEEIWQRCAAFPHYALEMTSNDLEEIFLHYLEGEKNDQSGDLPQRAARKQD